MSAYCSHSFNDWRRALARSLVCVVIFLAIPSALLQAQDIQPFVFAGASFDKNSTSNAWIEAFDGSAQCGVFTNGSKYVPNGYLGLSLPLGGVWSVEGALQYLDLSNSFETSISPALEFNGNGYDTIFRARTFDATLRSLGLSAVITYEAYPRFQLSAGPFAGLFIQHSYNEVESIVAPTNSTWKYPENGLTTRTVESGALNGMQNFQFGVRFGASYELPFQPHLGLRPSIGGIIPFTRISDRSVTPWRMQSLGASLDLVYHIPETNTRRFVELPKNRPSERVEVSKPVIPEPPKRPVLQVSVTALGFDAQGREVPQPTLSIERVHVTEVYPMLHYVFFDDGSAQIPNRYHQQTRGSFDEKSLFTAGALEIHHHVLDILGKRLSEDPNTSVTLVGTRSEHSPGDSLAGIAIARARAETVNHYLQTVWKISPERIHVRERNLPEVASDDHNPFGEAENRRVEVVPSSPDITAPLWTERIERVATPPSITFEPAIRTNAGIRTATITVFQRGRILRTIDALDSASSQFLWTLDEKSMPDEKLTEQQDSLNYRFNVIDSLGDTASATGVIYLKKKIHDSKRVVGDTSLEKQLERFSLILFDYSSSQLDRKESERIVHDMAEAVNSHADVKLTGHTDKTGDEAFNERLAQDRVSRAAQMFKTQLKKMGIAPPGISIESRGSRDELFDNSIPEGRVLSRTVRALIEKEAN